MGYKDILKEAGRDASRVVYRLTTGAVFAVEHVPYADEIPTPLHVISRTLNAVADLDAAIRAVNDDETLSDIGRDKKLQPLRERLTHAIAETEADLEKFSDGVRSLETATFAPPKLDKSDLVAGLEDLEIRDYIRGLDSVGRQKVIADLPKSPRLMEAIVRSPVPIELFTEYAAKAWAAHAAATHPDARRVVRHIQSKDWAESTFGQVKNAAQTLLKDAPRPASDRATEAVAARNAA